MRERIYFNEKDRGRGVKRIAEIHEFHLSLDLYGAFCVRFQLHPRIVQETFDLFRIAVMNLDTWSSCIFEIQSFLREKKRNSCHRIIYIRTPVKAGSRGKFRNNFVKCHTISNQLRRKHEALNRVRGSCPGSTH